MKTVVGRRVVAKCWWMQMPVVHVDVMIKLKKYVTAWIRMRKVERCWHRYASVENVHIVSSRNLPRNTLGAARSEKSSDQAPGRLDRGKNYAASWQEVINVVTTGLGKIHSKDCFFFCSDKFISWYLWFVMDITCQKTRQFVFQVWSNQDLLEMVYAFKSS